MSKHADLMRERQINVRLSEAESELLEFVTRHWGLNGANLFRMLLTQEANRLRGQTLPAEPAKKSAKKAKR